MKKNLRDVDGLLLLDKPLGLTSNAALQKVKYLFFAKKAGHTGSLDPLATGMLPICFGKATRFCQALLESDKHYHVTARLGIQTETGDAEGKIIKERLVSVDRRQLETALSSFQGPIPQVPPMYSALKYQGRPLYEWARKGKVIERKARLVNIFKLNLLRFEELEIILTVHCSKGTYIRTLIEDLGEKLGCGAYVSALRRTQVGSYQEKNMIPLETLAAFNQPADLDSYLIT